MQASRKEFVPGIDGRLLGLVHQDKFFRQAQAAGVPTHPEQGAVGQDPPLDGDVVVKDPLVFEGPDVAGQLGVLPLLRVLEVSLMVSVPGLPFRCTDSDILHQGLGGSSHLRLINNLLVHTPGSLHHADGVLPPAVAVLLPQVGGRGGDPGVVASHNLAKIGHGPVG